MTVSPATIDAFQADGATVLRVDGTAWPVRRDAVGASGRCALAVAARVGKLLGMRDEEIAAFLAAG